MLRPQWPRGNQPKEKSKAIYESTVREIPKYRDRRQLLIWFNALYDQIQKKGVNITAAHQFLKTPIIGIRRDTAKWEHIRAQLATRNFLKFRDKLAFVVGVANLIITSVLFGSAPHFLPYLYIIKLVALLSCRLVLYKRRKWHYYMFEMCYLVNVLILLVLLVPFTTPTIFFSSWGLANGPMIAAVATMKNSLVFHSVDKITSLMIHFDGPLTLFALRWKVDYNSVGAQTYLSENLHKITTEYAGASMKQIIFPSVCTYLIWQACYWVFVWELCSEKIKSGHQTTLSRVIEDKGGFYHKLSRFLGDRWQPQIFSLIQLLYTLLCLPVSALMFRNIYIHSAALIAAIFTATFNGANYYLEELVKSEKN